jgi:hypothetical protein
MPLIGLLHNLINNSDSVVNLGNPNSIQTSMPII